MREEPMVRADGLGVCYRLDMNRTTSLKEWTVRAVRRQNQYRQFWAVRDVSFQVRRGEVLGIIGHNGAGKSTLLKTVAGLLEPAEGHVQCHGRIVPLLELGSGFDPELTGRENIELNGAVLGYTKKYIRQHYDDIVDFSELGEFIHEPIKTYSSGMTARLAFSIATMVRPEILIVDEILAVGDSHFQKRSYERMKQLMTSGTTVLYVSHSIADVRKICTRAIWLDHGRLRGCGPGDEVRDAYEAYTAHPAAMEEAGITRPDTMDYALLSSREHDEERGSEA